MEYAYYGVFKMYRVHDMQTSTLSIPKFSFVHICYQHTAHSLAFVFDRLSFNLFKYGTRRFVRRVLIARAQQSAHNAEQPRVNRKCTCTR